MDCLGDSQKGLETLREFVPQTRLRLVEGQMMGDRQTAPARNPDPQDTPRHPEPEIPR